MFLCTVSETMGRDSDAKKGKRKLKIESEVLEKINYDDIIEHFISKNPKRMMLFK
jgi:hypothetical protein